MPSVELEIDDANDWLNKARRELNRLSCAVLEEDKLDHGLNLVITLHHAAEWVFFYGKELDVLVGKKADFLGHARNANSSVKKLHKIADATKHHTLDRPKVDEIDVNSVIPGKLAVRQDFRFKDFEQPIMGIPGGVRGGVVRTIIEDDEIIGFVSEFRGTVVAGENSGVFLEGLCKEALDFWDDIIRQFDKGHKPTWAIEP